MVIVKLVGGLGNQMFQYAAGKNIALLRNDILKFDLSWFFENKTDTPRTYQLNVFDLPINFATKQEINSLKNQTNPNIIIRILRKLTKNYNIATKKTHIKEDNYKLEEIPKNVYLDGYWQSEDYFFEIRDVIKRDFLVKKGFDGNNIEIEDKIKNSNSVSIHIRRGDYITDSKTNQFHGVCSMDYYYASINKILEEVENPVFFVFSDDIEWVSKNLKIDYPSFYVDFNTGEKSYLDLRLMSFCKHNIIANSSFSWWGAYLNNNTQKLVIAPQKWFLAEKAHKHNLIPNDWIKI
ncbi:MAG: hypothetical protein A2086_10850 [Spirochaetes bacterium GWD1_27_9]|nr:MAG: hypothetical protein A2Z98_09925 [Spirochaetes bacterium GWB1_27_13]OHD28287.1 MAG: hypothetical protein A2Y34_09735 [Spirochaetes bacterium GWC1_27_15]OHD35054.1 MAG: hypothetical protein A2086_10850 [Spirochaetes bacterium GWD1_27_9]